MQFFSATKTYPSNKFIKLSIVAVD